MMAFMASGKLVLRPSTIKPISYQSPRSRGSMLPRWKTTATKLGSKSTTMAGLTVKDAIDKSIQRLTKNNVTEPDYSALYLMAAALELPWERGIRDMDNYQSSNHPLHATLLTPQQASDLETMLKLREDHEPIQYVLGQWDFLDYTVAIRKPLLCPRPETEELVMMVASELKPFPNTRILDVGCGTGVIGISLAEILENAFVEAIDVEPVAIETSKENAQRVLKDRSDCYNATLVSAGNYDAPNTGLFDAVVSNPPYIPRSDMDGLTEDVTRYESDTALCGGTDGMDVIKTIIEKLPEWCRHGALCWMEVDPTHPKLIEEYLLSSRKDDERQSLGKTVRFVSSHQDMFGKDRFVKLRVEEIQH